MIERFNDSSLPVELANNGYYRVGSKIFLKSFNAVLESQCTKHHIQWDFNKNKFIESAKENKLYSKTLFQLYIERAKQLRDNYDYLILAFSGGADSDNILKVFTNNGIELDEIWSDFPKKLWEKANYKINFSTDPSNIPSEYYTVVLPELNQLAKQHPNIFINFTDTTDYFSIEDFEDTVSLTNFPSAYWTVKRWRYILEYASKLAENGKKVAIITGTDKPLPYIKDGNYGFLLTDRVSFLKSDIIKGNQVFVEYFYWTPNFPEIAVAQAKTVWNYLLNNKNYAVNIIDSYHSGIAETHIRSKGFDSLIKQICYPYWDFSKHQVNKNFYFNNTHYKGFIQPFKNERFLQSFSTATTILSKISPQYFNDGISIASDLKNHYFFIPLGEFNV